MEKPFSPINICMEKPFGFSGQTSNEMTRKNHSPPSYNINNAADDDEYIEIEVLMKSCSLQNTDFEFQMPYIIPNDITAFPADDLFYKGKLLPLLLPPRLQSLQDYYNNSVLEENDDFITMDFPSSMSPSKNNTTHQVEPTRLSFSFNLDNKHPKEKKKCYTWLSKLRLIRKSFSLGSFFRKSAACIDVSSAIGTKVSNKNNRHRRSFSFSSSAEYKRRRSPTKCLAPSSPGAYSSSTFSSSSLSSTSFSSTDFLEVNFHNRSFTSFTSDIEEAIVHCKTPQQLCNNSRKSLSKSGHCLATPKIATKSVVQIRM